MCEVGGKKMMGSRTYDGGLESGDERESIALSLVGDSSGGRRSGGGGESTEGEHGNEAGGEGGEDHSDGGGKWVGKVGWEWE